jgi:hypothetical protein
LYREMLGPAMTIIGHCPLPEDLNNTIELGRPNAKPPIVLRKRIRRYLHLPL